MYLFYQDHPRPNVSLRRGPRAPAPSVSAGGMSFSLMCRSAFQHQNVKYLKSVFPSFAKLSRIVWVLLMFFLYGCTYCTSHTTPFTVFAYRLLGGDAKERIQFWECTLKHRIYGEFKIPYVSGISFSLMCRRAFQHQNV